MNSLFEWTDWWARLLGLKPINIEDKLDCFNPNKKCWCCSASLYDGPVYAITVAGKLVPLCKICIALPRGFIINAKNAITQVEKSQIEKSQVEDSFISVAKSTTRRFKIKED